jgi:hypothetical protein
VQRCTSQAGQTRGTAPHRLLAALLRTRPTGSPSPRDWLLADRF